MRRVILFIVASFTLWSCTDVKETEEYRALQAQNDSLKTVSDGQSTEIYSYLTEFNQIQENLNQIKRKENIIHLNQRNANERGAQNQIMEDINTIYSLLKENEEKLSKLNEKYQNSTSRNEELDRLIKSLNEQIELKNGEIITLNKELKRLNIEVKDLTTELLLVNTENELLIEVTDAQEEKLNTAYYVVGTSKELKKHNIINKIGGFLGVGRKSKLDESFDKEYFTEINTSEFKKIAIYAKKVKVVTPHPKDSYELEGEGKKVDNLIIKDSDAFWSISKFLVIEVVK